MASTWRKTAFEIEDCILERLRLKVQVSMAVFFNIGLFQWHWICFPVFNCHSCPTSVFACPLGVIGQFAGVGVIPLAVVGTVALAGLIAGRMLCGWACPFGLLQDLLYKVPYVKFSIPSWTRFIHATPYLPSDTATVSATPRTRSSSVIVRWAANCCARMKTVRLC